MDDIYLFVNCGYKGENPQAVDSSCFGRNPNLLLTSRPNTCHESIKLLNANPITSVFKKMQSFFNFFYIFTCLSSFIHLHCRRRDSNDTCL